MSSGVLIAGTSSDAGKSLVVTGLCRALGAPRDRRCAVQGPEHVQQFLCLWRWRRDRPRPISPGAGCRYCSRIGDESRVTETRF